MLGPMDKFVIKSPPKTTTTPTPTEVDSGHSEVAHSSNQSASTTGNTSAMRRVTFSSTNDDNRVLQPEPNLKRRKKGNPPANIRCKNTNLKRKKKRKPPANIRRKNTEKMSRLKGTDFNYSDEFVLGQGATSIVYKGSYGINPAAIKQVMSEFVDVYKNELEIWQGMKEKTEADNVNIVTLFKWTD
ncbi:unnamed protein product [Orchesella dallaii]|uniref:Uncharacterized protein n=1 Tax=Orchesella dallaii TaxID=48710 RepID=A0ABP1RU06_9HEXA